MANRVAFEAANRVVDRSNKPPVITEPWFFPVTLLSPSISDIVLRNGLTRTVIDKHASESYRQNKLRNKSN